MAIPSPPITARQAVQPELLESTHIVGAVQLALGRRKLRQDAGNLVCVRLCCRAAGFCVNMVFTLTPVRLLRVDATSADGLFSRI